MDTTTTSSEQVSSQLTSVTPYLVTAIIALILFRTASKKKYNLPPGPLGLPIVGYAPLLGSAPYKTCHELSKKYGTNLIGFKEGTQYFVVANDYTAAKELLGNDVFLDRPESSISNDIIPYPSVITVNGQVWKQQRRYTLQQLRDLGFGKSRLEEHIQEEILCLVKKIARNEGKPPNLHQLLSISTSNNIRLLMFGHRLEYDDPRSIESEENIEILFSKLGKAQFQYFLPSWVKTFLQIFGVERAGDAVKKGSSGLISHVDEEIREHKRTFQEDYIRDYIDGFLLRMKSNSEKEHDTFNDDLLYGNASIFFLAGSDTVKTTLTWIISLMAVHQDVQERAYNEVVDVIGRERMANWSDHTNLPYCEAVIAEVHRHKTIVPLNVERSAPTDTSLQGFDIPKDTVLLSNIWAIHNDPTYWKNPEKFDPTRFLSEDGKRYVRNERLLPFSAGKRSCPGETMAHIEVFLYFVTFLQRFRILPKEGEKCNLEGDFRFSYQPKSVEWICFKERT